jgi:hypothetical protein
MAVVAGIQGCDPKTKPFLGGWKNTVTGLIYHNACTQTHSVRMTRSRITQTVAVVDAVTDVVHDQAVQVQFLPDARDKIIASGVSSFETPALAEEIESCLDNSRMLDSIVKIQRCYR